MPTDYSFRSSILRYLCPTKSSFFEHFWWRHCMWFVVWAPPNQKSWLRLCVQHVPWLHCRSKEFWFFLVCRKALTKLSGSFRFNRYGITNACDEYGSFSSIATILVVKLFDVQEESLNSSQLLPLSRFKSCYRFLHLHSQFRRNNNKILYRREQPNNASISKICNYWLLINWWVIVT